MTPKGFRTLRSARDHATPDNQERPMTQNERQAEWLRKEPIYTKYEELHPGEIVSKEELSQYKIFWREWIVRCPAFRSDRIFGRRPGEEQCGAMAIITRKMGREKSIICPACGYQGEYFGVEAVTE